MLQMFRIKGVNSSSSLNHNTTITFQLIIRGEGKYFVNYRCYDFQPNCLLVSRPNDNQRCMPERGSYMDKICLRFPSSILLDYMPLSVYLRLPCVVKLAGSEGGRARQLMLEMYDEIRDKPAHWYRNMISEIRSLVIILFRCGLRREEEVVADPRLRHTLDYIEENFRSEISIPYLGKKMDLTERHLLKIFQDNIGMGIKHYILQRRIAEAKLLLHSRHLEVRAIARQVGYKAEKLFLFEFTRFTGMTPEQYRAALFDSKADEGNAG